MLPVVVPLAVGSSPTKVNRNGDVLRVTNVPLGIPFTQPDSGASKALSNLSLVSIFVGFDRTPTRDAYDAIVPPYTENVIAIPASVNQVYLTVPNGFGAPANSGQLFLSPYTVLIEWLPCGGAAPGLHDVRLPVPVAQGASGKFAHGLDSGGGIWQPEAQTPVVDFAAGSNNQRTFRPKIAPSITDIVHVAATGVATLFDFTGPNAWMVSGLTGWRVVHRIYVSVSAATMVVIGSHGLTVGAPGAEEVWRGLVPAGVATPIEFGEGLDVNMGTAGTWRCQTAVSVALDATVVGG